MLFWKKKKKKKRSWGEFVCICISGFSGGEGEVEAQGTLVKGNWLAFPLAWFPLAEWKTMFLFLGAQSSYDESIIIQGLSSCSLHCISRLSDSFTNFRHVGASNFFCFSRSFASFLYLNAYFFLPLFFPKITSLSKPALLITNYLLQSCLHRFSRLWVNFLPPWTSP